MTCYEQAIRVNPDDAQPHIGMAAVLSQQSDRSAAITKLQDAIRLNPPSLYSYKLHTSSQNTRPIRIWNFPTSENYQPSS